MQEQSTNPEMDNTAIDSQSPDPGSDPGSTDPGTDPGTGMNSPIDYTAGSSNNEDAERRKEIAGKFYSLTSSIKLSFEKFKELLGKTEVIKFQTYISLTVEEEQELLAELDRLNENIGKARTILDSYITFTRSSPDFEKFLNIIFQVHEYMETYAEQSIFYQFNKRQYGKCLYSNEKLVKAQHKLSFLFNRLCGTLTVAGDYIIDLAYLQPAQHSQPGMEGAGGYYRPDYYGGGGYGGGYGGDWRNNFTDRDYDGVSRERKKRTRDIGDVDDKL